MSLVNLPVLLLVFSVGAASIALAAGGGGSAGGSGAQNAPASGLPPGESGPAGSPNNPHPVKTAPTEAKKASSDTAAPGAR